MHWNTTKINNGRNFQETKFLVLDLVLTDKRCLSGTRSKSACGKSSSYRFSFSAARKAITKATENVTFFFVFWFSFPSFPFEESLNVTVSKRYGFFSVLTAIIRKNPTNDLELKKVCVLSSVVLWRKLVCIPDTPQGVEQALHWNQRLSTHGINSSVSAATNCLKQCMQRNLPKTKLELLLVRFIRI